jgi:hypothetical protein
MSKLRLLPTAEFVADSVTIRCSDLADRFVAVCGHCAESADAYSDRYGWLTDWADTHHCDPELVALLALTELRAA